MNRNQLTRRSVIVGATGLAFAGGLVGLRRLERNPTMATLLRSAEFVTERTQRALLSSGALAREYGEGDISPVFLANGTTDPTDPVYRDLALDKFINWRLEVSGLVGKPAVFSLDDLRAMPSRTQITRHDCVEGWSCIGKWKGVPLAEVLRRTGVEHAARFVVFHCADELEQTLDGSGRYYESIAIADVFHPQTILAYEMNDRPLPVSHGAPIRLRLERQLGYKMAKYVMAIELVASFAHIGRGRGGFWEDRGYEWYAGI